MCPSLLASTTTIVCHYSSERTIVMCRSLVATEDYGPLIHMRINVVVMRHVTTSTLLIRAQKYISAISTHVLMMYQNIRDVHAQR
jgi:hypothetical protein